MWGMRVLRYLAPLESSTSSETGGGTPPPVQPPVTSGDVGKQWTNSSTPLALYPSSSGGSAYAPSNAIRTYTVLAAANGRVQIQHSLFSSPGNKVWVNQSAGRVS